MATNEYTLYNFHGLCDTIYSFSQRHHCFGHSSQLDYNGCGLYSASNASKINTIANFYATSPSLPYFLDKPRQQFPYVVKDCLITTKVGHKDVLLWSTRATISGHCLETNSDKRHHYSSDDSVSCGPFRHNSHKTCQLFGSDDQYVKPIIELKANDLSEVQSNSRNKITFYRFSEDSMNEDLDITLDVFNEIDVEDVATNESAFECCDRNAVIDNQLIISYKTDDVIHLYDLEDNESINAFKLNSMDAKRQIGLQWTQYNPNVLFYGETNQILCYDSRGGKPVITVMDTKHNDNQYKWETFHKFMPSKLNEYQLFVATDYHIFINDCRFAKHNLMQLNHMIPTNVVRNLKSLVVECDEEKREIVVTSDLKHNCLMSFKRLTDVTALSSLHLPLHASTPIDVNIQFEEYIYRGVQLIDSGDKSGFSLAVVTQFGDIFMQDFYWNRSDPMNGQLSVGHFRDRTCASGLGSKDFTLSTEVKEYLKVVNDFLFNIEKAKVVELDDTRQCVHCCADRVCKLVANECHCRDLVAVAPTLPPDPIGKKSRITLNELLSDGRYFEQELVDNFKRLEDSQYLDQNVDNYTKSLLEGWRFLDQMRQTGGASDSEPEPMAQS